MHALLALFNRSLRQDVRAKSTYWARGGLVMIMLGSMFIIHGASGWAGAPGLQFFSSAIYTNFFFISLAGLSYFASAVTEEKEEMTLGLLRMTNLNPLSILLGKSTSRLFGALLLLAAQFPFTLLAVSLGGVAISQIVAAYFTLAAYILFLSNLALLWSVVCPRTASAAIITGAMLLMFFVGPGLVQAILGLLDYFDWIASPEPGPWLAWFLGKWVAASPFGRLIEILSTGFAEGPICFQVVSNTLLGLGCFLLAWAAFNAFCSDQKDAAPRRGLVLIGARAPGRSSARGPFGWLVGLVSAGRPGKHALIWKDFHFIAGGKFAVFVKLAGYAVLLFAMALAQSEFFRSFTGGNRNVPSWKIDWSVLGFMTMWVAVVAFMLELTLLAGRIFRQERRWKTLSSLAMLPMTMRRVAYHKMLGGLLACWPAVLLFAAGVAMVTPTILRGIERWWADFQRVSWNAEAMFIATTGFTFAVLMNIFFLHLVAFLSLRFKWGALPLAIAFTYIGGMFALPIAFMALNQGAFFLLSILLFFAICVLHTNIGQRLEELAAED